MRSRAYLLAALLLALAEATRAQAPQARNAYFGIGLGGLAYEVRNDGEIFFDTTARATKLYGGFRVTRNWGFEFTYEFTDTTTEFGIPARLSEELAIPGLPSPLPATTTARLEIATMRGLRFFRRDWGTWYLSGGVSGAAVDTKFDILGVGAISAQIHTTKNGLTLAAGAQWTWPSFVLRLEYDWWDADMASIGLSLHRRL